MKGKVLVSGAGIGGLATGLALKEAGFEVQVFERHSELRTTGVGLNVWPNGARVLYGLGLREEFDRTATLLNSYKTYSSDGSLLGNEDLVAYRTRYGAPVSGVYRRDLSRMLAKALGEEHLQFNAEVTAIKDHGDRVTCYFSNGEQVDGACLIGADGINSKIRTQLFGHREFKDDEHIRWRGLFRVEEAGVDPYTQADVIGASGHIGWLPIGRGLAYWYGAGEGLDEQSKVLEYFGSWSGTKVPKILQATADDSIIRNVLTDLSVPLEQWGKGRITLLGDAAHPMLPGVAQGANQALVDAVTLVDQLTINPDFETALRSYESVRTEPVNRVVKVSRSLFDYDSKLAEFKEDHNNPIFGHYAHLLDKTRAA